MHATAKPLRNLQGHATPLRELRVGFESKLVGFVPSTREHEAQRDESMKVTTYSMATQTDYVEVAPSNVVVRVDIVDKVVEGIERGRARRWFGGIPTVATKQ